MTDFIGNENVISNELGRDEEYWEVVLDIANMPLAEQTPICVTNVTADGGITNTLAKVQAMYASVKEYEGFYIARYESGINNIRTYDNYTDANGKVILETNTYSTMGKIPYTYIPWAESKEKDTKGAVQIARSMYPATNTKYGVVSTLTYGVQWDTVLQWWLDTSAIEDVADSKNYGNHKNHVINSVDDLNDGALVGCFSIDGEFSYVPKENASYPKEAGSCWALSTGALKAANVNNIYDMAGNMWEWTMEGTSIGVRVTRGGDYGLGLGPEGGFPVADRMGCYVPNIASEDVSFRPSLYIKK